ncbi:MAG: carbon-nitrogen hydrolase family protein [Candidatus Altiarchaeota archaeon]|nr:carbon-nitrogen hydrolase family protein [Candidatus Altiarchaeota archaeon]
MPDIKKIAIAQTSAKPKDLDYNTGKVIRIIRENKDADLILFPELVLQGHHHKPSKEYDSQSIDVGTLERIQEVCKECMAATVVGALEVIEGKHYNCAFYIDENKVDRYIKTHVHWTEEFTPGDQLRCINTRIGKLGMLICFDSAFTEMGRCLALMGAKVFAVIGVVPTEFNEKYMTRRLQAMATDNQVFVLYANKWKKDVYNGGSCIIGPRGSIIKQLGDGEGILRAEIDMDDVDSWREEEKIYRCRRPELYGKILEKGEI